MDMNTIYINVVYTIYRRQLRVSNRVRHRCHCIAGSEWFRRHRRKVSGTCRSSAGVPGASLSNHRNNVHRQSTSHNGKTKSGQQSSFDELHVGVLNTSLIAQKRDEGEQVEHCRDDEGEQSACKLEQN